jgi:hypothetical protein
MKAVNTLRRLLHRLRLHPSPSVAWADAGQRFAADLKRGMDKAGARRAELLASGLTPEEAQAVMWREMVEDPGFPALLAYTEGVVMRSFGTLYEDEGDPE